MEKVLQPLFVPITDRLYSLVNPYSYSWSLDGVVYATLSVPKGFVTDGASVPRFAWTITGIRPDGLIRAAALIHDWLYFNGGRLPAGSYAFTDHRPVLGRWRRKDADKLFARIMRECGVAKHKRRMAYLAVRLFGWRAWGK